MRPEQKKTSKMVVSVVKNKGIFIRDFFAADNHVVNLLVDVVKKTTLDNGAFKSRKLEHFNCNFSWGVSKLKVRNGMCLR